MCVPDHLSSFWDWTLLLLACKAQLSAALPQQQKPLHGGDYSYDDSSSQSQYGTHGAVASESAICSKIGIDLMRQGVRRVASRTP